ncbi:hypothetical protein [Streptomyces noursei]|uniref:hypothetical protein n=1 Tax=Streptomyces noursei TaxID=1971 RepID=UPI0037F98D6B
MPFTEIDWGNAGFIRLYGLVFGLATVMTMVQWLISVAKRAIRGVPITQALMENVGYLLMSVVVAGFMPVVVAYTVDFVDSSAEALLGKYISEVFVAGLVVFVALALIAMTGAGAVIAIPMALMILLAVFGLWAMLIVRSALILLGLIFGPLVFSGLVDKDLWGHTRKWVGIMGGIIVSKLGIYLALALAGALMAGFDVSRLTIPQAIGTTLTFTALLFIALFMPFQVAKWLPFVGDEIQAMTQVKDEAGQRAKAARQQSDDMKNRAASKNSAGGGGGGGSMGAASKAAPPAAAAMAVKEVGDQMRDQTVQAAKDGANNASGDGGGQQGGGQQGSGKGKGPGGAGGSQRGGGRGGSGGGSGGGGARRPAPPPPRSSAPGARPGGAPPPPPRQGGQPPPPAPAPPPPPPAS